MCNPLEIDVDDIIKLNEGPERWEIKDFSYNNEDPTKADKITLDVEIYTGMETGKQINLGMHIVMDENAEHFDVDSWTPEINQIILNVTYKHSV